ncbi:MAG: serine/threonine-protein kinase, partial [Verrucomicrobiota bacterium]
MSRSEERIQSPLQPVGVLLAEALCFPETQQGAYLKNVCGDDAELRGQLEKMLNESAEAAELEEEQELRELDGGLGVIGDYEIQSEIARGGMGVVYRARQISLDRIVAIKLIRETSLASAEDRARFRIEAEAAAGIDHPHLVPIYEIGEEDSQLFYSMKLIEGGTLATPPEGWESERKIAVEAMAKVARALQAVHEAGVLHRDLKPGNVLLDEDGEPFLTDFGLARRLDGETMLTLTGQVMGTPNYLSPEQARGGKLTTASDVYGFGAVLYQVLTGNPPFAGESTMETLNLVAEEPPKSPGLKDRDLETIVMKCLEKAPADRYSSAAAVAEDLERWVNSEPISARPATPTERMRKWVRRNPTLAGLWALGAVLVATLAIGGPFWALNQGRLNQEILAESKRRLDLLYIAEMNQASDAFRESSGLEELQYLTSKWAGPEHEGRRGWEWRVLSNEAKADEGRVLLES